MPGQIYLVSLWLDSPNNATPNEFSVSWGGNVLMDQTNIPNVGWTNIQFFVTAIDTSTVLQLGYRNGSSAFGLDDVSVTQSGPSRPVITQASLSGTNFVVNGSGGQSNRTYYLLMGTNLAEPFTNWIPVASNTLSADGNFSVTATNAVVPGIPSRFFILMKP
jgi:hypothetical protein